MSKRTSPIDPPTGAQLRLLEIVSEASEAGLSAADVWQKANKEKPIARTTVITLLGRLVDRGWLAREGDGRGALYRALHKTEAASAHLAGGFLDRFFGGSPSKMMLNLLGTGRITPEELASLRKMLDEAEDGEVAT